MHLSIGLSLAASLAITVVSADHMGSKRNHAAIGFSKRDAGAQFTFYKDGLGACGTTNTPSDFIVALNSQQFDGGAHCFETITITVGGKTSQATIVDECMGCGANNLDFSQGLFDFFGPESAGVLHGSWSFGSGNSNPSPTPAKAIVKASPKPSSTARPTSTKDKTSTSTSITKHATTHTSTPTPTPSSSSSSVTPNVDAQTMGTITPQEANVSNLYAMNMAFMALSEIVAGS